MVVVAVAVAVELRRSFRTAVYSEPSSSGTTSCWLASPAPLSRCKYSTDVTWLIPDGLQNGFLPQDLIGANDNGLLSRIRRILHLQNAVNPQPAAVPALQAQKEDARSVLLRLGNCGQKSFVKV